MSIDTGTTTELIDFVPQDRPKGSAAMNTRFSAARLAPVGLGAMAGEVPVTLDTNTVKPRINLRNRRNHAIVVLASHVARLAQADKVSALISFGGCRESTMRLDVMNGQTIAHVAPTIGAFPVLLRYDLSAQLAPIATTVSRRPANPERRRFARLVLFAILTSARYRTVCSCTATLVQFPRLALEGRTAIDTSALNGRNPLMIIGAGHLPRLERPTIGLRRCTGSVQVPNFHFAVTSKGTKAGLRRPTLDDHKHLAADFTRYRNPAVSTHVTLRHHDSTAYRIRQMCGTGTTVSVAMELGRRAVGVDIADEYNHEHGAARIERTQPALIAAGV